MYIISIFFVVFVASAANKALAEQLVIDQEVLQKARAASVLFVNQVSDIFTDQGLASVVKDSADTSSFFGAASCGGSEYKTKVDYTTRTGVNLKSSLFLGGFAKRVDLNCGRLLSGAFYNYGNDNYDVSHYPLPFVSVEGHNNKYHGGGLFGRFDFKNNLRGELSGHIGKVKTDFDFYNHRYGEYDSLCLGWHAGLGYLHKFNDSFGLDTYGRYLFMRQKGEDVKSIKWQKGENVESKSINVDIKFFNVDSKRLRLGTKLLYNVSPVVSFYGSGAYEYEFGGDVNLAIADKNIDATRLKGGTGVYGVGLTMKSNTGDICVDLGVQRYFGSREGLAVTAKVSTGFLNFLGSSVEKFEKEKTGRFEKIFNTSQKDCFNKSLKIIEKLKARVVHKNSKKGYIVAFDFSESFEYCLDSTEVGIFITDGGSGKTKVEVISNNSLLAKNVSTKFFEMLEQQ
ncbi:hypothetical protein AGMMS49990_03020 [Endomicrobiia bacterium]|nr:hypothetical protein AGMMS49990_03020 [Endomicrobiia bacterium]